MEIMYYNFKSSLHYIFVSWSTIVIILFQFIYFLSAGESSVNSGWYPTPQVAKENDNNMLNTIIEDIKSFGENILRFQPDAGTHDYDLKRNHIRSVLSSIGRNLSAINEHPIVVNCNTTLLLSEKSECDSEDICLFDVKNDPCEYINLAKDQPEIVDDLLGRIKVYETTMVKPRNKPFDPNSNPSLHHGAWVPWLDDPSLL